MNKQLKITIARKRTSFFLMLNKQEFSTGFKTKSEGFQVIIQNFLEQKLSLENLKNLFVTITNSDQIPSFSMYNFLYEEKLQEYIIQISETLELTNILHDYIQMIIDLIEIAMTGPAPRFVHHHNIFFIQYGTIEKVSDIFIETPETLKKHEEVKEVQVMLDLKRTLQIIDKQFGEELIKDLYQNGIITVEDYDNLMIELRKIPIPEKIKKKAKEILN